MRLRARSSAVPIETLSISAAASISPAVARASSFAVRNCRGRDVLPEIARSPASRRRDRRPFRVSARSRLHSPPMRSSRESSPASRGSSAATATLLNTPWLRRRSGVHCSDSGPMLPPRTAARRPSTEKPEGLAAMVAGEVSRSAHGAPFSSRSSVPRHTEPASSPPLAASASDRALPSARPSIR